MSAELESVSNNPCMPSQTALPRYIFAVLTFTIDSYASGIVLVLVKISTPSF